MTDISTFKAKITIAGAGPVGAMLAIILSRAGYQVEVFESRPDSRLHSSHQGKSINITLSSRAWLALEYIGIANDIKKYATAIYQRVIHQGKSTLCEKKYQDTAQGLYSISREKLNNLLLEQAQNEENITLHFEQRLTHIDFLSGCCSFSYLSSGKRNHKEIDADLVFAADGAFSKVRRLAQETPRFSYSQHYMKQCYIELTIAANSDGSAKLTPNAYHIWPRNGFLLVALPNEDASFTCTLYLNHQGSPSFSSLNTPTRITEFFEQNFAEVVPFIENPITEFMNKAASPLFLVSVDPWVINNKVSLIGDAAHAMVPFFGQGLNCSFEDCYQLAQLIKHHQDDWQKILPEYYQKRKNNADAISKLSKSHFIELSALSTSEAGEALSKTIARNFASKYPMLWPDLDSLILFHPEISYAKARKISLLQQEIIKEIMAIKDIKQCWQQTFVFQRMEVRARGEIAPLLTTLYNNGQK